ncbi:sclerostin domain-containing protein 1-like [Physella acuta]|uniref:sclerostin domain-containing protein 1-like n=1 Tax=Physella acuta TaxID=109671 RepID=UPI0027DBD621|nr:sclerostin domain-containing protein 1-like [Physella acuta]XP_059139461.1 sclerostin domain-containing protein 1-like [Physella acuta]XP_059139462.1 sclerostin domain-containing protein 1-like [Physella acuta]
MLVLRPSLTLFIVAVSLAALLTTVSTALPQAATTTDGSGDRAGHATEIAQRNCTRASCSGAMGEPSRRERAPVREPHGYGNKTKTVQDISVIPPPGGIYKRRNKKNNSKTGKKTASPWTEDIQVGCRELRARRYISDGFCTSETPILEVVCTGNCLPIKELEWYAEFIKTIGTQKLQNFNCVDDVVTKKKVKLLCQDGSLREYRIKVVKSCKCKKIKNIHNRTSQQIKEKKKKKKAEKGS